jgi:hypothetical protein
MSGLLERGHATTHASTPRACRFSQMFALPCMHASDLHVVFLVCSNMEAATNKALSGAGRSRAIDARWLVGSWRRRCLGMFANFASTSSSSLGHLPHQPTNKAAELLHVCSHKQQRQFHFQTISSSGVSPGDGAMDTCVPCRGSWMPEASKGWMDAICSGGGGDGFRGSGLGWANGMNGNDHSNGDEEKGKHTASSANSLAVLYFSPGSHGRSAVAAAPWSRLSVRRATACSLLIVVGWQEYNGVLSCPAQICWLPRSCPLLAGAKA